MTELAIHQGSTLALTADQDYWNDKQLAALRHMGVEHAGEGDLAVFHHVCTRTGLDPFAKQIYMIGRQSSENINGDWVKVTKYTIQTGIDGFRLIGRRAANRTKETISLSAPEWAHEDGSWRPVWRAAWGSPVAARVTIKRNGEPFEAVALFDEYKQTKRNGDLTSMWAQRPAGQIAKCAEALVWRMAFPQDLSGIYTDDEMGQADNTVRGEVVATQQPASGADRMRTALKPSVAEAPTPTASVVDDSSGTEPSATESPLLNTSSALAKRLFATMGDAGITERADRLAYASKVLGREIGSSKDLTDADAELLISATQAALDEPFDVTGAEVVDEQ